MPTERACRFEQDGNLLDITLLPELAEVPWADVEEIGGSLEGRVRDRDKPQVIVDLTPLAHMGSGMVALVVRIWKAAGERGGRMVVLNDSPLVEEVLGLAGLKDRWTIVETREQARKHLTVRGAGKPAAGPAPSSPASPAPTPAAAGAGGRDDAGGIWLAAGAVVAVLAGVNGLVLGYLAPDVPGLLSRGLLFGGSVLAIVLGALALAWYAGMARIAGVAALACGVCLLVAGLLLIPGVLGDGGGDGDDIDLESDLAPGEAPAEAAPPTAPDPDPDPDPAGEVTFRDPAGERTGDGNDLAPRPGGARAVAPGSGIGGATAVFPVRASPAPAGGPAPPANATGGDGGEAGGGDGDTRPSAVLSAESDG